MTDFGRYVRQLAGKGLGRRLRPLTAGTVRAIRERAGTWGDPAYPSNAAQRRIERNNLAELIADFDKMHGPAAPESVAAKRSRLTDTTSDAGTTT